MTDVPRIFATFRYRNPKAIVDWLEKVVGFGVESRFENDKGELVHAELSYGASMIMIGGVKDDAYGRMVGGPGENGGKSLYIAVDDVDALFARVEASGARILEPLTDRDYGNREFICADAEGNVWSFGIYMPKAGAA